MTGSIAQAGFDKAAEQALRAAAALQVMAQAASNGSALWKNWQEAIKERAQSMLDALGRVPPSGNGRPHGADNPPSSDALPIGVNPGQAPRGPSGEASLDQWPGSVLIDWTQGATEAWDAYLLKARDTSSQIRTLFDGAFSGMEDAIYAFVTRGKFAFGDFAKSIIADMAQIAARQAASGLLSLGIDAAISAFSSHSQPSGTNRAGYSSDYFPQAKGGAWEDGVELSQASSDAVVSRPTLFGMAGHRLGLMGEAGPEAIMPLTRMANGGLGVRAAGSGQPSIQVNAPVNVNLENRASDNQQLDHQALQRNLQRQMKAAAERAVAESWVPGGTSYLNTHRRS
jgi:hypothetical protein